MPQLRLIAALAVALPLTLPMMALAQNAKASAASLIAIPDISQLEYRSVTIAQQRQRLETPVPSPKQIAHLWVMPAQNGERAATGLGWDGVPYEVQSVGAKADWHADVVALLKSPSRYDADLFEFGGGSIARQFLLQLGAADLDRKVGEKSSSTRTNRERIICSGCKFNVCRIL